MAKFEIPFAAANGGLDYAILTGKRPVYSFADGKRTSDIPSSTSIAVALQGNALTALNVKIDGNSELLPEVDDESIKAACAAIKPILVRFKDGNVSLYSIEGQMKMSGTASAVEIVSPSAKA